MSTMPQMVTDPHRLTDADRARILIPHIARLLYDSHHGPEDKQYDDLTPYERAFYLTEANAAILRTAWLGATWEH